MSLGVLITARDDDYGGDFLSRLLYTLDTILKQSFADEIVVVEWNSDTLRRKLPSVVRVITVPPAIHATLPEHDRFDVFEYRARNVGLRRMTSDFILSTSADIIFPPEMAARLRQPLDSTRYYRADRHDLWRPIPFGLALPERILFCRDHDGVAWIYHGTDGPHTDASGDFTLMAKSQWMFLGGYPEWASAASLDSYLLYLAEAAGLRQVRLTEPIYHQFHWRNPHRPDVGIHEDLKGIRNNGPWGLEGVEL